MRKCEVFLHGSRHVGEPDRGRFLERAGFFHRASLDWLHRFETRTSARPVVLMLSYGYMHDATRAGQRLQPAPAGPRDCDHGSPSPFAPQRVVAIRRARWLALVAAATGLAGVGWWLARLLS
jgi:hypothetical protein